MRPIYVLLLVGSLFMITGCPIPAYYTFSGNQPIEHDGQKGYLTNDSIFVQWMQASPWRDHQKKVVIIRAAIENISRTNTNRFIHSQFGLRSPADTFHINFTRRDLANPFIVEKDTLLLEPGQKKEIAFYYLSNHNYTKKAYKKSIEPDTLALIYEPASWSISLQGKRNY